MRTALAVITGIFWTLVPRRLMGKDKPWQRRGIRYVRHDSGTAPGFLHAIYFNQGGGYIGGATLYWARNCRRYLGGGCGYRPVKFAFGLTRSGNLPVTAGRYEEDRMNFREYTVKICIAEDLTEDGFTLTNEKLHAALCRAFPLRADERD